MKMKKPKQIHFIVEKLINIMNDRKLNKSSFADLIGFPEPKWNKISNGWQLLNINDLSIIAEKLRLREIDIITFPDVYVDKNSISRKSERYFVSFEVSAKTRDNLLNSVLEDKEDSKVVSDYIVNS